MSHQPLPRSECPRGIDAGAYVLHALNAEEGDAFAGHLADCAHCRLEVDELRLVVDTLPNAAPQMTPPPALKSRIMAVVGAESELLLAAGPEADRVPRPAPSRARRWLRSPFAMRPAFAGALACALLALGVVGGIAVQGSDEPETRALQAWAEGPAEARLLVTGDKASLELANMPSLGAGRVYQVWLDKGDGQLRPTHTLFNVRSDGRATVAIEESVAGVERILVTTEKTGGALAPNPDGPVITASPA
ncbi:MAG: hypothetical protein JWO90_2942 [Solirubrobacterales bacterium]|jgi:anti-sigma-K factor RskA|nr:hypothetical protein [Solirubrobacterales bacterium]